MLPHFVALHLGNISPITIDALTALTLPSFCPKAVTVSDLEFRWAGARALSRIAQLASVDHLTLIVSRRSPAPNGIVLYLGAIKDLHIHATRARMKVTMSAIRTRSLNRLHVHLRTSSTRDVMDALVEGYPRLVLQCTCNDPPAVIVSPEESRRLFVVSSHKELPLGRNKPDHTLQCNNAYDNVIQNEWD
jgi:hypothetical protein